MLQIEIQTLLEKFCDFIGLLMVSRKKSTRKLHRACFCL